MTDKPKQWFYQDPIEICPESLFLFAGLFSWGTVGRSTSPGRILSLTPVSLLCPSTQVGCHFLLVASTDAGAYSSFSSLSSTPSHPIWSSFLLFIQPFLLRLYGWKQEFEDKLADSLSPFSQGSSPTQGGTTSTSSSRRWRWNIRGRRRILLTSIVP